MRQETKDESVQLVQALPNGVWAVRWDFKPVLDEYGNETGVNQYEEEEFYYIPTITDIQNTITQWFNKQTDGLIKHGFIWNNIKVLLNDENKFNYKAITDEATRRENLITEWDEKNPTLAGLYYVEREVIDDAGNIIVTQVPTGRPVSLLPITLKLGTSNTPENFYVFNTLFELQKFFSAGVDHLLSAYSKGWYKIATFDWQPYVDALAELENN